MATAAENREAHQKLIQNPSTRQALFQQFAPTFLFHSDEDNFPNDPDTTIEEIITAKRAEYIAIREGKNPGRLTEEEEKELTAIDKFFWKDGKFNKEYKKYQNDAEFAALTGKGSSLLIFDEKHYGYQVGEKIDVVGVAPEGHRNHKKDKKQAPLSASIFPTEKGFFIQYEYLYPLNNAINGTQWLRRILPEWISKALGDFGFHYGDAEKVGIYVTVENGVASFKSMQTWAHGRDYAQNVAAEHCTFDENGHVSVFVGVGGHPSYAHNFVGRNLPMDLVGTAYKIKPDNFIDVSPDVIAAAGELADIHNDSTSSDQDKAEKLVQFKKDNPLAEAAIAVPGSLSAVRRFADSNPTAHNGITNEEGLRENFIGHNTYQPWLFLVKVKNFILSLFSDAPVNKPIAPVTLATLLDDQLPETRKRGLAQLGRPENAPALDNSNVTHQGAPTAPPVGKGTVVEPVVSAARGLDKNALKDLTQSEVSNESGPGLK